MVRRKSKSKKSAPEKVFKLITWEEVLSKEQKYQTHIANLRKCLKSIEESKALQTEIEAQELLQHKWLEYVNCSPLPKPYIPPDIRLGIEKLKFIEDASVEANINWRLSVNERSILSQDIFAKDLTNRTLRETIKPNFGHEYNDKIEFCLSVLRRIQYFLLNDVESNKCSLTILKDIKNLRWDVQNEIQDFFNRFTYRILSSEKDYMNSVDACTADYSFQGEHFQIHIWCLKNVPIRFNQLEEPYMIAHLGGIKMRLQIPADHLELNFTIRAIHFNFDHVSEKAINAFQAMVELNKLAIRPEIDDLPESLLNEWQMQLNIQNRIRTDMLNKRQEYEVQMRLYLEQQEKNKRAEKESKDEKDKGPKQKKILKPSKEPPILADDMFPEVWDEFLDEEQRQYEQFINLAYNPEYMDLSPDEINLKKYSILGGIYQLYKVTKPIHFDFQSFDMTWHKHGSNLAVDPEALIKPFLKPSKSRMRRSTNISHERTLSIRVHDYKPISDCPWYTLIIEVPAYLCDWGEPIVCQYASITKTKPKTAAVLGTEPTNKVSKTTPSDEEMPSHVMTLQPEKKGFTSSILNIQRPSQENFFRTSLSNIRLAKFDSFTKIPARDDQGILNLYDFPLTTHLKNSQIRDIQRHILPRLISSFKFPKEIREDEILAESQNKKTKGKGGVLIRKRGNVDAAQESECAKGFYFGHKQNNPERIIALFSPVEAIRVFQTYNDDEEGEEEEEREEEKAVLAPLSNEPNTFADLLRVINDIKWHYKLRIRNMLDLKAFKSKSKFPIFYKRLDGLVKRLRKGSTTTLTEHASFAKGRRSRTSQRNSINSDRPSLNELPPNTDTIPDASELPEKELKKEPTKKESRKKKVVEKEEPQEEELETYSYECWTTKYILKSDFNREKRTIVIQTDRLGYFGLAFKHYEHFPFKYWKLEPNPENAESELLFTLDTQFVRCILNISDKGIKGYVTEPSTKFVRNPKMYLVLKEPISDYIEFKRIFKEKYLNIFADHDASYYIENGYFCPKHLATELHTYNCMAINCTQIKFSFSQWNRLSKRRDILLKFLQYQDLEENTVEVRIAPEEAFFVETTELCSDDVDVINLQYNLTWRNLTSYSDLNNLVNSMYLAAHEMRCKNAKLIYFVRSLLSEIRPLSFS